MPRNRFAFIVALLLPWICPIASARAQDDPGTQIWLDYHAHYYRNAKQEFYGDGGLRFPWGGSDWQRIYVRPSLRFHRQKLLDVHAGMAVFYENSDIDQNELELRPWQGVKFRWPVWERVTLSHYVRLEERFFWDTEDWSFDLRGRYKLGVRVPLRKRFQLDQFYIPLSAEIFGKLAGSDAPFASELRLDVGLGYIFNGVWVGEFHFIVQDKRASGDDDFEVSNYILRFQLKRLIMAKDYRRKNEDLPD